jgi:hypothetical protein
MDSGEQHPRSLTLPLVFGRIGISAVTVRSLNDAIFSMNDEFSSLIAADLSTELFSLNFCIRMNGSSIRSTLLDVPSATRMGNYVV